MVGKSGKGGLVLQVDYSGGSTGLTVYGKDDKATATITIIHDGTPVVALKDSNGARSRMTPQLASDNPK
jgi:hypothetical protein